LSGKLLSNVKYAIAICPKEKNLVHSSRPFMTDGTVVYFHLICARATLAKFSAWNLSGPGWIKFDKILPHTFLV
jgi:hypothetical protein